MKDIYSRLKELGINLRSVTPPLVNYVNAIRIGNLLYLSGKGPKEEDHAYITDKLGVVCC